MGGVPDTLTLYWANAPFTLTTLPTDKIVVLPDATDYIDTTVPTNSVRYYMLEAVKAGANTQYSQCLVFGNYPKTGPGPKTIKRGNWANGYFGLVPTSEMLSFSALRTAVGADGMGGAVADSPTTDGYHKFIYGGKIIYIPTRPLSTQGTLTWTQIYNRGLIYGVDGPGEAPFNLVNANWQPPITAPVNQLKKVTIGTDELIVRAPKNSTNPTNVDTANASTGPGSEWWNTICNMSVDLLAPNAAGLSPFRWGDIGVIYSLTATQHFSGAANNSVLNAQPDGYFPRSLTGAASGSWISWTPVLELIY